MHPHHSLAANQNHVFWPQNSPFFHRASKISHTFPHFPPFFLNQPISDKCTVTFRKRVFLRPVYGMASRYAVLSGTSRKHAPDGT